MLPQSFHFKTRFVVWVSNLMAKLVELKTSKVNRHFEKVPFYLVCNFPMIFS